MLRFECPQCKEALKMRKGTPGCKVKCPSCHEVVIVPPPVRIDIDTTNDQSAATDGAAHVEVVCPGCGRAISLPPNELDMLIECAACEVRFIPQPSDEPLRAEIDPGTYKLAD
jgi:hypothetical protein